MAQIPQKETEQPATNLEPPANEIQNAEKKRKKKNRNKNKKK